MILWSSHDNPHFHPMISEDNFYYYDTPLINDIILHLWSSAKKKLVVVVVISRTIPEHYSWLVVWTPLVKWDDYSQYMGKSKSCSKPPTTIGLKTIKAIISIISPAFSPFLVDRLTPEAANLSDPWLQRLKQVQLHALRGTKQGHGPRGCAGHVQQTLGEMSIVKRVVDGD